MTPETPVMVKSGKKATPMIRVENAIGRPTSPAAAWMRRMIDPEPWPPRWRKMFSIMITVESITIPKSTAPSEIRLAGVPSATIPVKAIKSAIGMLRALIVAAHDSEAGGMADGDVSDVAHAHRNPLLLGENDVSDVPERADQSQPAD